MIREIGCIHEEATQNIEYQVFDFYGRQPAFIGAATKLQLFVERFEFELRIVVWVGRNI